MKSRLPWLLCLLFLSANVFSDVLGAREFRGIPHREPGPDPNDIGEQYEYEELPKLQLEGKSAKQALDILIGNEFQCAITKEMKTADPSRIVSPMVDCLRLLLEKDKVYGILFVTLNIKGWKGDGTPLIKRFDQLPTSTLGLSRALGHQWGGRKELSSSKASIALDKKLVFAAPGQSVAQVIKQTMSENIYCGITRNGANGEGLRCSAIKPSIGCRYAATIIEITESTQPLTIWSEDRRVAKQNPWQCIEW